MILTEIKDYEGLWLRKNGIIKYVVRPNGLVDVNDDVDLRNADYKTLPIQFGHVTGTFRVGPKCVDLKGLPKELDGMLEIKNNSLLSSLKGCPTEIRDVFNIENCPKILSLVGCPRKVGSDFYSTDIVLETLEGLPKEIGGDLVINLMMKTLPILDLLMVKTKGRLFLSGVPSRIRQIMNQFSVMPYGMKRIIDCQSALIDAGFEEWAELGDYNEAK